MTKELILLATSKKYGRYCVAGIDTANGKWIRLVSHDSDAHYAIDAKDLIMDNGAQAEKLDVVGIELTDKAISYFQTENYIIRKKAVWHFVRKSCISEVLKLHPANWSEYIFYSTARKIARDFYKQLPFDQIHSLMLISPEHAEVHITQSEDSRRVMIKLDYRGRSYEPLPVTDLEFLGLCGELEPGVYPMHKKGIMLCSVGECFERDQQHYKLIAGIMLES